MALCEPEIGPDGKPIPSTEHQNGEMRVTEVVERLERLALSPGNLAKLTAPWAG